MLKTYYKQISQDKFLEAMANCLTAMPAMYDGMSRHFAIERHGDCRSK